MTALSISWGLFYFNEDGDFVNTQMIDLFDLSQEFYTDIDNTSLAAYGEVDLNFTDKFSASLGVRYTDEEREQNHSVTTDGGAGFTYLDTWAQTYGVIRHQFRPRSMIRGGHRAWC